MKNPYSLLGAPQNADEQQLREACQAMAQQHEGDARRMREIDDAYDAILLSRGGSDEALALLACVPEDQRGSEWHYRMGCVQRERGWLEEAEKYFSRAALFEPENRKYRAAFHRARRGRSGKRSIKSILVGDDAADTCMRCCCECCGLGC